MRIGLASFVFGALAASHAGADGVLDPSFGNGGIVLTAFNGFTSAGAQARAGAISPDGKIVAAGTAHRAVSPASGYDIAIARYNTDGSPDAAFGTLGQVVTDFGSGDPSNDERVNAVAVQADGRIVVAGTRANSGGMLVARYLTTGLLDPQFGTGGVVLPPVGSDARAVKVDALGRILVGGDSPITPGFYQFAIVRLTAAGALDSTFGTNGTVTLDPSGSGAGGRLYDLAVQPDGRILASGERSDFTNSQVAVCRFLENGNPDGSFGNGGVVLTDIGPAADVAHAVALQPDGKVVVAGRGGAADMVLVRYTAAGVPDGTFGSAGIVTITVFGADRALALVVQPDGKLVTGGSFNGSDFLLARITDSGLLDTTFGTGGIVQTDLGQVTEGVEEVLIPDPGRLLAIGTSFGSFPSPPPDRFALARYTAITPVTLETFSVE